MIIAQQAIEETLKRNADRAGFTEDAAEEWDERLLQRFKYRDALLEWANAGLHELITKP